MGDTRFDSRKTFGPNRAPSLSHRLLTLAAGLCLFASGPAEAGSIFMKNGYIIQGPIVEHQEGGGGCVVLGWPHGKVTIYRRFIERIDFEPGEELAAKAVEPQGSATLDDVIIAPGGEEELPQSLSELVKAYKLPPSLLDGKIPPPSAAVDPIAPGGQGSTPETVVHVVPPPPTGVADPDPTSAGVVETVPPSSPDQGSSPQSVVPPTPEPSSGRVVESEWGFSVEPPSGWVRSDGPGIIAWSGPAGSDGFAPSMNISSVGAHALSWEEACRALREDQSAAVGEYLPLGDEKFEISGRPAYRVAGQGSAPGGAPGGRKVVVRQSILEKGGKFWLISAFLPAEGQGELAEALDRSVRSFQIDA